MKKVKEVLPDAIRPQPISAVAKIQNDKIERKQKTGELMKVFQSLQPPEKYKAISNQTRELGKTRDTVALPGRVLARDEPEVLYIMVLELFHFAGISDNGIIRTVVDIMVDSYGWMALQDFALFFRKIKSGNYGEVYGKMNGMWITGKISNFQKSVQYNMAVDREAEHFARKQDDGCRGLGSYYDDIRPDVVE